MKKSYAYPFYLIINEADQPLFSIGNGQIWLFYREQDVYKFLGTHPRIQFQYPSYKKRYVIKVFINSVEEIKEYITSIL